MAIERGIRIRAVGDVSLAGGDSGKNFRPCFRGVSHVLREEGLTLANLESPLTGFGKGTSGKCLLRASRLWAKELLTAGIGMVSLANNHIMDYGRQGLYETMSVLEEAGVQYVGAGKNERSAEAPLFLSHRGQGYAVLARCSGVVSSPCYAGSESPGVAYLGMPKTMDMIRECKREGKTVILMLHWGLEHYSYPSPSVRKQAMELIEAGADLIIGHHPHVLQGVERIGSSLVSYSLGNFVFDDVKWSFADKDGNQQNQILRLNDSNRKGGVLKVNLSNQGVDSYEFVPSYIGSDGVVKIQNTIERQKEFARLCGRLWLPIYSVLWRFYSVKREWELRLKPLTVERLSWASVRKLRLKHFREICCGIKRSGKITSGHSTNPYE
jgi:hypothetical protein